MVDLAKISTNNQVSIDTQKKTLKINTLSVNDAFKYLTPRQSTALSCINTDLHVVWLNTW